jgi:nucleoid DNA-binding protein
MTKKDLVLQICDDTDMQYDLVVEIVQKTLDCIAQAVSQGRKVEIRNFGVFDLKVRKARMGRNPKRPGADVPIPQRAIVKFKPGKEMRESVVKLTPKEIREARAQERSRPSNL